jgi:glycosyltransferase involved in cell wall biosynthesis
MNQPLLPDIGVVAQVQDTWGDCWQARHHILVRLARYFHVVWMNPPRSWREILTRRDTSEFRSADSISVPGFTIYDATWPPEIYRPGRIREFFLRQHLRRARRLLTRRGCKKIILSLWRPRIGGESSSVHFDLRSYHVDDEYSFSPVEMPIGFNELQTLREADEVFVTSQALLDKKGWVNAHTTFLPNGVDYHAFASAMAEPPDLASVPHPRIGYSGFLKEQLDWPLLLDLSVRHPEWHFVFVGPVSPRPLVMEGMNELRKRKNVHFLGAKSMHLIPSYAQHFDVCIMPYRLDDYTKYIYPLKLHEYLASGRPTVGTRIPSLEEFSDVVALPRTPDEWSASLAEALAPTADTAKLRSARRAVAKCHDWDLQVNKIARTLAIRVAPELVSSIPELCAAADDPDKAPRQGDLLPDTRDVGRSVPTVRGNSPGPEKKGQLLDGAPAVATLADQEHLPIAPVLLVTPWYRPAVGGVAEVAERLHRALTEAGVETHLMVADSERGGIQANPAMPNLWRLAPAASAFDHLSLKSLLGTCARGSLAFWQLKRFVRSHKIRTIVLIYPISYSWLFLLLRHTADVSLIASLHGNDVTKTGSYEAPLRWLIRRVLLSADAIIACANHLATKAQELCPNRPLAIELISNCVDSNYFVPPPPNFVRSDSRPTFVHVSNFAPKKRTSDIVEAFADPRMPSNARLIMVGDGPDLVPATNRARSLGVSRRIEFVGMQQEVRPFLWEADIFVLASDDEGAPLALLEAMACGLPWVSTAWGPAAILPPGECGFVVPPHSPDLLAAAMVDLIKDPERRLAMARRARYRAETDFQERAYVERHLQVIRSIQPQTTECHGAQTKSASKLRSEHQ